MVMSVTRIARRVAVVVLGAAALHAVDARAATVAATPPMGWNSWNTFGCAVTEQDVKQAADALVTSGMRDAGYGYVVVDDCWFDPQRAADGQLRANASTFPSGIPALARYVHERGLLFGIYEVPGERTCAQVSGAYPGSTGSRGHEAQDARTFAAWGVDYLKYDYCSAEGTLDDQVAAFSRMRDALRATGRPIVYSINPNSLHDPTGARHDWSAVANLVRISQDVVPWWDTGALQSVFAGIVNAIAIDRPLADRAGPGHFNDADMLVVGTQAASYAAHLLAPDAAGPLTALLTRAEVAPSLEEMRTHLAMWALLASPLIAGNDIRVMSPAVRTLLLNRELIAVNQDPLGAQARAVRADGGVWAKRLRGGAAAVALLNSGGAAAQIATTTTELGLAPGTTFTVRDLWTGAQTTTSDVLEAEVPAHGVAVYRLTPPQPCRRVVRLPRRLHVRRVVVVLDGRRVRALRGPRRSVAVLVPADARTHRVRLTIRTARGHHVTLRRVLRGCAA